MTAGQRYCHDAIAECIDRYGFDDVLFALQVHVLEQAPRPGLVNERINHIRKIIAEDTAYLDDTGAQP